MPPYEQHGSENNSHKGLWFLLFLDLVPLIINYAVFPLAELLGCRGVGFSGATSCGGNVTLEVIVGLMGIIFMIYCLFWIPLIITSFISGIKGTRKAYQEKNITSAWNDLWRKPYPYLLLVGVIFILVILGILFLAYFPL